MSNDSRSLAAVLVICAMLGLAFIAIPIGVGAFFYLQSQRAAEQALVTQRAALATEQARQQLEAARQQADLARLVAEMKNRAGAPTPAITPPTPKATELTPEVKKTIYQQLKLVKEQLAALEALGADDPALKEIAAQGKLQTAAALDQIADNTGITRQQLDEIMAQGEREKW